jgi:hypothetical protein
MPACARPFGYVPRQTHECDAAVLVRRHLAEFLGRCEERAGPLPAFVKAEPWGFAGCGDFELGFVRTCCRSWGDELRVPFSCKSRGYCPSCMGRRMAEGAALLVDHVLPAVGYRQWVLSFPGPMAVRLGYDAPLLAAIAGRLARAVMQDMRRGVKQQHGLASVAALHAGVVTVVQRFRSDLGLYVHLHCLVTDGAYEEQDDGELRFLAAAPPTPERMTAVLAQVHEVIRAADDDLDIDPALAACLQLSLAGPRPAPGSPSAPPPMTLSAFGMNLHAATTADGPGPQAARANLPLPPAPALRPRRRHGAPRRPRPRLVQGALAQRHRSRRHGRPPVPRPPLRPGPAARLPHDALLRRARQPPSPARARHPQARRTAAATAPAGLRPGRILAHVLAQTTTHRLGKAPRPRLCARHHPLPKMRRPHACPRGRLRPRRHRPHLARRPRSPCASSSRPAPVAPLTARPPR